MKHKLVKGTKLVSKTNKGLIVIFKSFVGSKNIEFRTIDDFQFRINEFEIID
jgi:hypothetical protein